MLSENKWKVFLVLAGTLVAALDRPSYSLANQYKQKYPLVPYRNVPMFYPKNYNLKRNRGRQSRVLFLDDEERLQPYGRGEIDLTVDKSFDSQIKFDQEPDYDFTSPDETKKDKEENKEELSGNQRFYDAPFRRPLTQGFIPKYYQGRYSRPYAPSHYVFEPHFNAPFAPAVRNSFYGGWKARSPRVVFPYPQDNNGLSHTNSHGGPGGGFNDNVVFRDTNFGLNEVPTDDLALQDLGTTNTDSFSDRDANKPHRAHNFNFKKRMGKAGKQYIPIYRSKQTKPMFIQTETTRILPPNLPPYEITNFTRDLGGQQAVLPKFKPISDEQILKITEILKDIPHKSTKVNNKRHRKGKRLEDNVIEDLNKASTDIDDIEIERQDEKKCPQGGTCEFFFYCWMVGGLLEGSCGGLLKGCCHRVAKAGILGVQDSNSIDYSETGFSYGPVINDKSKFFTV